MRALCDLVAMVLSGLGGTPPADRDVCSVDPDRPVVIWNQLLSAASCASEVAMTPIDTPDEVEPAIDDFRDHLEPSLQVDKFLIVSAPDDVAFRAAYQLGSTEVSLVTRARAAVTAGPEAARTRDRLEAYLAPDLAMARLAFRAVISAAETEPAIVGTTVAAAELRLARAQLSALGDEAEAPDDSITMVTASPR